MHAPLHAPCLQGGGSRVHASSSWLVSRRVALSAQGGGRGGSPYPYAAPQQQQAYRQPYVPQPQQQQYYQQQQPAFLEPQPQAQQQAPQEMARRTSAALVPTRPQPQPLQPTEIYLDFSLVAGKQVITRTQGRNLGNVQSAWVDPLTYEVVSLDIDDKKSVGSRVGVANVPLTRLTQIGDVCLVSDDTALYEPPLDGRFGYYTLTGMEVRTRSGDFLGKIRDFSFSPDTGAISRIIYDDFGLSFLPVAFFDTYSIPMSDVMSMGPAGLTVYDEAKYRERRESAGVFTAIPSLLRSFNGNTRTSQGMLTDGYRADSMGGPAGYLPQGYGWSQWENDVRRWEMETGLSYEQYTRQQRGGPQALPGPRAALPASYGSTPSPQTGYAPVPRAQQPQQPYGYPQAARRTSSGPVDPRVRIGPGAGVAAGGLPPRQQQYGAPYSPSTPATNGMAPGPNRAGSPSTSGRGPTPGMQPQSPQAMRGSSPPSTAQPPFNTQQQQQQPPYTPMQPPYGSAMQQQPPYSGSQPPYGAQAPYGAQPPNQASQQASGGVRQPQPQPQAQQPGQTQPQQQAQRAQPPPPQQQQQQQQRAAQPRPPQAAPKASLTSDLQQQPYSEAEVTSSPMQGQTAGAGSGGAASPNGYGSSGPSSSSSSSSFGSSNSGSSGDAGISREPRRQFENWLGREVKSSGVQELELLEADASWRSDRPSSMNFGGDSSSSSGYSQY